MRFFPPTTESLSIGLTSGHMAVIPAEGIELPAMFHREAMARGAVLDQAPAADSSQTGSQLSGAPDTAGERDKAIRDALNAMLDGGDEGDFNTGGKPNLTKLNARVGFQVSREEADAIFTDLTA